MTWNSDEKTKSSAFEMTWFQIQTPHSPAEWFQVKDLSFWSQYHYNHGWYFMPSQLSPILNVNSSQALWQLFPQFNLSKLGWMAHSGWRNALHLPASQLLPHYVVIFTFMSISSHNPELLVNKGNGLLVLCTRGPHSI